MSSDDQFRRNRTLSSYRHNTPEESMRQKTHHLVVQRRKLGGIFLIITIATVFLLLLVWQLIAVVHVATSTTQLSKSFTSSIYEQSINNYLNLNPMQRLKFALDENALSRFVSTQLPEVEKVSISGTSTPTQENFAITFRQPVAGWQIGSQQSYVDASGVVFSKNYYDDPKVKIVDESTISTKEGTAVASSRLLGFLGRVVSSAEGRGYTVVKAVLPAETTREVDVYLMGVVPHIKFSIDRGAGEQVEDMDRVLKFLKTRSESPSYVDVRVSGRAAYK